MYLLTYLQMLDAVFDVMLTDSEQYPKMLIEKIQKQRMHQAVQMVNAVFPLLTFKPSRGHQQADNDENYT